MVETFASRKGQMPEEHVAAGYQETQKAVGLPALNYLFLSKELISKFLSNFKADTAFIGPPKAAK